MFRIKTFFSLSFVVSLLLLPLAVRAAPLETHFPTTTYFYDLLDLPHTQGTEEGWGFGMGWIALSPDASIIGWQDDIPGPYYYVYADGTTQTIDCSSTLSTTTGCHFTKTFTTPTGIGMIGEAQNNTKSFLWKDGLLTDLGTLPGYTRWSVVASATSDGSMLAGYSQSIGGVNAAWRWTEDGGMVALGDGAAIANVMTPDGSVIAGNGLNPLTSKQQAYFWTAADGVNYFSTFAATSTATLLSTDGAVIAGYEALSGQNVAYRWTAEGGKVSLGTLGGATSTANAMSADGSVIIGTAATATQSHGFVWTAAGGAMQDVGTLGGTGSRLNALSADGKVALGYAFGLPSEGGNSRLVRWTQASGLQTLEQLLEAKGVDLTGWVLGTETPTGTYDAYVSADGKTIYAVARHTDDNGMVLTPFIARYDESFGQAILITPEQVTQSLLPSAAANARAISGMSATVSQSMLATQSVSTLFPAAGPVSGQSAGFMPEEQQRAAYVVGSFGLGSNNDTDNFAVSGSTGMFFRVTPALTLGAGVTASRSHTETYLSGHTGMAAVGAVLHAAYEAGDSGLRLYGTGGISRLDVFTRRHYMNGANVDGSEGDTSGTGYGAAFKAGYRMPVGRGFFVMPYAEGDASHTIINGYTETSGSAPVSFGGQRADMVISRLGAEVSRRVLPTLELKGRAAWGHEVTAKGTALAASVLGFTTAIPYDNGSDKNWAEAGLTANWRLSPAANLMADLSGRSGHTAEPQVAGTVGLSVGF